VIARTEYHGKTDSIPGDYRELCREGTSCGGGVSHIPEFSAERGGAYNKPFSITRVGSQTPSGVNYKGYLTVKGGNTYLFHAEIGSDSIMQPINI
jgi:hypothetical protein